MVTGWSLCTLSYEGGYLDFRFGMHFTRLVYIAVLSMDRAAPRLDPWLSTVIKGKAHLLNVDSGRSVFGSRGIEKKDPRAFSEIQNMVTEMPSDFLLLSLKLVRNWRPWIPFCGSSLFSLPISLLVILSKALTVKPPCMFSVAKREERLGGGEWLQATPSSFSRGLCTASQRSKEGGSKCICIWGLRQGRKSKMLRCCGPETGLRAWQAGKSCIRPPTVF